MLAPNASLSLGKPFTPNPALDPDLVARVGTRDGLLNLAQVIYEPLSAPGDFDGDSTLTAADVDLLTAAVLSGTNPPAYDLNGDTSVNAADRTVWVKDLKNTWFGDADLNGVFNSSDIVAVFMAGKYETGANAGWAEGDWNGDGLFNSSDFVAAFVDGGYEQGPRMPYEWENGASPPCLWLREAFTPRAKR